MSKEGKRSGGAVAEPPTRTADETLAEGRGTSGPGGPRIRCPLCKWQPRAQDRWSCKCKHSWNTFDTGGVCPGCLYQWKITQCLACHQYSPHSDWYTTE